ncbi:MAG: hypothetical protein ACLUN9_28365, partial [Enterocloster aldenensis]
MNEKSLIYSLLSKFLDDDQEDGIPEHAGEDEREGLRTQGQPHDNKDRAEDGLAGPGSTQDSRNREGWEPGGRNLDSDHRVETVEDWNEAEVRRREQMERELLGKEQTGADGQDGYGQDSYGQGGYGQGGYGQDTYG